MSNRTAKRKMALPFVILKRKTFEAMEERIAQADKRAQAQRARRANALPDGTLSKSVTKRLAANGIDDLFDTAMKEAGE